MIWFARVEYKFYEVNFFIPFFGQTKHRPSLYMQQNKKTKQLLTDGIWLINTKSGP